MKLFIYYRDKSCNELCGFYLKDIRTKENCIFITGENNEEICKTASRNAIIKLYYDIILSIGERSTYDLDERRESIINETRKDEYDF